MFLSCSTAGFISMVCQTKPALSRFSNVLKIYATLLYFISGQTRHNVVPELLLSIFSNNSP